ncbi:type I polyketide synthase [Streptomyces genisteinicus]|uniref:type I polyketide synthase n=1 Tax=Streptomyces genisteinicus TaxID=2768068 RepID=UPI001FE98F7F|nr:type I polyketide synthase [Streptomyces genisteinicus]
MNSRPTADRTEPAQGPGAAGEQKLLQYLKRVTADLAETRQRLAEAEGREREPLAVVGMACRYPGGADDPEGLWELVREGRDAIGDLPAARGWGVPGGPGALPALKGGFIDDADRFDAALFGISPREALTMDPQQRVLLETVWQALERAGIPPLSLRATRTGVFVGAGSSGYGGGSRPPEGSEGHLMTGMAGSVLSGRISYTFGLEGPSVTVDTACSSSLVAVHQAARALHGGECDLAVTAGVAILADLGMFGEFGRHGGLSPDGRCKSFGAGADGTGWSEGAGVLLLERLSDAVASGHQVHAVLYGSAVNSDGATNGLTAPNGRAQRAVIRAALADARLLPSEVDAVEAHGTGTRLGDPIEAEALLGTYGQGRTADEPLWLGSVKSNIGHAQAAAGMAGLIKMIEALRHGVLPRTLHAAEPSPHIDWESGAVRLLDEERPWVAAQRPRRAAVSSFGLSGTNAHVILGDAPAPAAPAPDTSAVPGAAPAGPDPAPAAPAVVPVPVSGRTAEALAGQARRLGAGLDARPDLDLLDIGRTLATTRSPLEHRAVVLAGDRAQLAAGLAALAEGRGPVGLVRGEAAGDARLVFLFTGQGSQRTGMGRGLHAAFPVFADAFDAVCARLDTGTGPGLRDLVLGEGSDGSDRSDRSRGNGGNDRSDRSDRNGGIGGSDPSDPSDRNRGSDPGDPGDRTRGGGEAAGAAGAGDAGEAGGGGALDRTVHAQAGLFALEVALFRLLESWGTTPDHLVGHSVGELAAAHVAGVLSLDDACTLVAARGRLMQALPEGGAMLAVQAGEDALELPEGVGLAAVNGPDSVTLSGDADAIAALEERLRADGVRVKRLTVSHAFHSHLMEPMLDEFAAVARTLTYHPPALPVVSTLTGGPVDTDTLCTPDYWVRQVRETVRFADAVSWTRAHGAGVYLELGPGGTLAAAVRDILPAAGTAAGGPAVAAALRPGRPEPETLLTALATAHTAGAAVDWRAVFDCWGGRRVPLPTYAFDRDRYWVEPGTAVPAAPAAASGPADPAADRFWTAVEEADAGLLAETVGLADPAAVTPLLPALTRWRRESTDRLRADSLRYRVTWRPLTGLAPAAAAGHWLAVLPAAPGGDEAPAGHAATGGHDALPAAVTAALRAAGAQVTEVAVDLDAPADRGRLAELLKESAADGPYTGVVSLIGMDDLPAGAHPALSAGLTRTLALTQAAGDAGIEAPLWALTRGAVAVGPAERVLSPRQAALWGFGRVAALELPGRWGGLVDLPETLDATSAALLVTLLAGTTGEDQTALRPSGAFARRIVPAPAAAADGTGPWRPEGTVLVTGGTGALGVRTARLLAERGAAHVVLAGRRGPEAPGVAALAAELAPATRVTAVACDVTDKAAVAALLAEHDVRTVVHAAGVTGTESLETTGPDTFAAVLDAKVRGAEVLDELLAEPGRVERFVLFSSVAGVWGSGGQSAYAAANAHLDALAERRRAAGLPATSVAWGPWDESGMAADEDVRAHLARRGLTPMAPAQATAALAAALDRDETTLVVADIDWQRFAPAFQVSRATRLFGEIPGAADTAAETAAAGAGDPAAVRAGWARTLAAQPPHDRPAPLVELVRETTAAVLGHRSADSVGVRTPFRDLGVDSLTAVELRDRLAAATGLTLPAGLVFDHSRPGALGAHLAERLGGTSPAPAPPAAAARPAGPDDDPVAVVGIGCRFPGGVRTPEDFWQLIARGEDAVTPFPTDRGWDLGALLEAAGDAPAAGFGAFLDDVSGFDAAMFGISPREALAMDPQQRLLLETAWEAAERAGIAPGSLHGSDTGVFVGSNGQDYGYLLLGSGENVEGHLTAGVTGAVLSGRLSYTLGLQGPALTVDTACSSGLVAVHTALRALRDGECSLALAGGVSVMATPGPFTEFGTLGGLAPEGRCKAFADGADGTGWGEGAGMLLLERLSDARRNGHPVLAVLRGSAVNQDGASNGLSAPSGPAQQRVIRAALASAGLEPGDVDAVEAHGTGTALGDPIEAEALLAAYGQDRAEPLWTGSVKSNIGHTQAAAGIAGIIKMALAMRHGVLPRTLHVDRPTTKVDWSAGDVALLTEARPWPETGRPRRAGVSSFGVSGTNAHVVLEAPAPEDTGALRAPAPEDTGTLPAHATAEDSDTTPALPLVLSARTPAALRAQAAALHAHLAGLPGDGDAPARDADAAYTLATARTPMEHRAVVVGRGRDRLLDALGALAADRPHPAAVTGRDTTPKVAFVFPGQGTQWEGMAAGLLDESPVFAARFDECAHALAPHVDFVPADVLRRRPGAPDLERVDVVQPLLWAIMVSLAEVWRAHGVTPSAVIGHSQGEIAAAVVSGALPLADGAALVALRAKALTRVAGQGRMLAVALPADRAEEHLAPYTGRISLALVNGPRSAVVSGEPAALEELDGRLTADGVRTQWLPFDYAAHSTQMEAVRTTVTAALAAVGSTPRTSDVPFYSSLTGDRFDTAGADADYWFTGLRETARFDRAATAALRDGHTLLVEVSPHPVLTTAVQETAAEAGRTVAALGTLHRGKGGRERLLTSLAEAHVLGAPVDFTAALEPWPGARLTDLPTYPFQRTRYWPRARAADPGAAPTAAASPAESRFWAAVDDGDTEAVAATAGLPAADLAPLLPALTAWHRDTREQETVAAWRYRVTWDALEEQLAPSCSGRWLLVAPDSAAGTAEFCRAALTARQGEADLLLVDPADVDAAELADLIRDHVGPGERLRGVVSLLALDETPHAGHPALTAGAAAALHLLHAALDTDPGPLWTLTAGAVGTGDGEPPVSPGQAAVWGLGRVAALEHPGHWGGLIDLPAHGPDGDPRLAARLAAALTRTDGEDQMALRARAAYGRRLRHAETAPARPGTGWRPTGTALITGGTGAVGGHVARWLAAEGADHLVLLSRRGPDAPGAAGLTAELTALGARVTLRACDVEDRADLERTLAELTADGVTVRAVLHTAGLGELAPLAATTVADLARLMGGKAAGARHLDELLDPADLDAVVHFSSVSAVWGVGSHGAYAAANAYLDTLAELRGHQGAPVRSVAWGPWDGGGMVGAGAADLMARRGIPLLRPAAAMVALRQALDAPEAAVAAAEVDWAAFVPSFTALRPSRLLSDLPEVRALAPAPTAGDGADEAAGAGEGLRTRLATLSAVERGRAVVDLVRTHAAVALGHTGADEIEPDRTFRDLGIDSLTAVALRDRLTAATGLTLPATLVFDQPTPVALAEHLGGLLLPDTPDGTADALPSADELDRLETALARRADDDLDRVRIVMRLESLLSRTRGGATAGPSAGTAPDGEGPAGPAALADRLGNATNDELFALVERDLGLK